MTGFFRYPAGRASITHMSRAAWAVNRAGICVMAASAVMFIIAAAVPGVWALCLPAFFTCIAGLLMWFLAGSPV